MAMTVNEDDTVDGSMVLALSQAEANSLKDMDMDVDDLFGQLNDPSSSGFGDGKTEIRDYNQDGMTGKELIFQGSSLASMTEEDGGISITRDGDDYVVSGNMDMSDQEGGLAGGLMGGAFEVSLAITFPGPVKESNGEISGNTVTWKPKMGEANSLTARAASGPSGPSTLSWILMGGGAALLVVAAVVVALARSRKKKAAASAPEYVLDPQEQPLGEASAAVPSADYLDLAPQVPVASPYGEPPAVPAPGEPAVIPAAHEAVPSAPATPPEPLAPEAPVAPFAAPTTPAGPGEPSAQPSSPSPGLPDLTGEAATDNQPRPEGPRHLQLPE
jgi:hypothetical protein